MPTFPSPMSKINLAPQPYLCMFSERRVCESINHIHNFSSAIVAEKLLRESYETDNFRSSLGTSKSELDTADSSSISNSTNHSVGESTVTYCSDSSSSQSSCGVPLAISASTRFPSSMDLGNKSRTISPAYVGNDSCSREYSASVVDLHELSHEERTNMIKHLLINGVVEGSSTMESIQIPVIMRIDDDNEFYSSESREDIIQRRRKDKEEVSSFAATYSTTSCGICLSHYELGESVSVNPYCRHMFHEKCIVKWIVRFNKCPCCTRTFLRSISQHGSKSSSNS